MAIMLAVLASASWKLSLAVVLTIATYVLVRLKFGRWLRGKAGSADLPESRCVCGYQLDKLDRVRCPECGRVFGFDATAEELGLNDDELREAAEARERRKRSS